MVNTMTTQHAIKSRYLYYSTMLADRHRKVVIVSQFKIKIITDSSTNIQRNPKTPSKIGHLSHITCHLSQTPSATDPPPAVSHNMQNRLVHQNRCHTSTQKNLTPKMFQTIKKGFYSIHFLQYPLQPEFSSPLVPFDDRGDNTSASKGHCNLQTELAQGRVSENQQ